MHTVNSPVQMKNLEKAIETNYRDCDDDMQATLVCLWLNAETNLCC